MRKIFINFVSVFVAALVLIISLSSCGKEEENVSGFYAINYDESKLNLGTYAIKSIEKPKEDYEILTAEVESGVDFYNNVIKKNECYNSSLDFKRTGYTAFGYMWKGLCLYHYEIKGNNVYFKSSFGWSRENVGGGGYQTRKYVIPGPLDMLIYETDEVTNESDYERYISTTDNVTYDELVKIYRACDPSFYEIGDDYILIKAKFYPGYDKTKLENTTNYFCKVTNDNGKAVIFKIKY